MDTPITTRRSIPTELKPRLRYAGQLNKLAKYTLHLTDWGNLTLDQRRVVTFVMGIPSVSPPGIITFYAWPSELITDEA